MLVNLLLIDRDLCIRLKYYCETKPTFWKVHLGAKCRSLAAFGVKQGWPSNGLVSMRNVIASNGCSKCLWLCVYHRTNNVAKERTDSYIYRQRWHTYMHIHNGTIRHIALAPIRHKYTRMVFFPLTNSMRITATRTHGARERETASEREITHTCTTNVG